MCPRLNAFDAYVPGRRLFTIVRAFIPSTEDRKYMMCIMQSASRKTLQKCFFQAFLFQNCALNSNVLYIRHQNTSTQVRSLADITPIFHSASYWNRREIVVSKVQNYGAVFVARCFSPGGGGAGVCDAICGGQCWACYCLAVYYRFMLVRYTCCCRCYYHALHN